MITSPLEVANEVVLHLASRFLGAARWFPAVEAFGGYGSSKQTRILARVLMTATGHHRGWLGQRRGWEQYVDLPVPRQPVLIRVGDSTQIFYTDRGGYLDVTLHNHNLAPGWHFAEAHVIHRGDLAKHKRQLLAGRAWHHITHEELIRRASNLGVRLGNTTFIPVQIVGPNETIGIISDIDDSILVTDLPRPLQAARNAMITRPSERTAVPGMAAFLEMLQVEAEQALQTTPQPGTHHEPPPFFYLSTGAWNTAPTMTQFLLHGDFPRGTLVLRPWGVTDAGHPRKGKEYKLAQFTRLVGMYPHVKWLLLGDNGQHDPTTFTTLANAFPHNIAGIFIRTLSAHQHMMVHGSHDPLPNNMVGEIPSHIPVLYGADGYSLISQIEQRGFRRKLAHAANPQRAFKSNDS